jgi:hypothetical protein
MPSNITFRTPLVDGVSGFCDACRLPIFSNSLHLVELIVLLAKYKEEGSSLYPEVYVTTDINAIAAMLPDAERFHLGSIPRDVEGIKRAIKKAAPLATGGWLIYIEDSAIELSFVLFRGSGNPVSVLVDRVLLESGNSIPVTKVFQVAEDCVEISNCSGERHFIFLNHRREDSSPPLESLIKLIDCATTNVVPEYQDPSRSYLTRVLYNALRTSHGALVAVTHRKSAPRRLFNDGMPLREPIDFPALIRGVRRSQVLPDRLTGASSLLEGMLNSDGIILFNSQAQLLGFNYFVRSKVSGTENGGARRRAFSALSERLGKELCGVFIQSQDGWSDFKEN